MYEWQSATVFEASHTITQLQEGWTYEYRVGSLCIRNEPLFGPNGEATLPDRNEERIQNCGKVPAIDLSNQEPNESLKVGDMVRIGGDFPMRVDELTPLGNGWYSGKGGLVLPWIFEIGVNLEFARLRVNTDNVQIDGEVETSYDEGEALIGNTNQLDNGGSKLEQGGIDLPSIEADFTIPDRPSCTYNEDTGKLVIADENGGNPHTVTVPKNEGKSSFPIEVVDAQGNRYQVDLPADADLSAADSTATGGAKEPLRPTITKIEDAAGTINTKELSKEAEFNIRFTRGEGKYAFDEGREDWLQDSKLLRDEYYKRFGENYVAPWKLVPVGQADEVTATLAAGEGFDQSKLDRSKIKFVTADGKGVAAKDDGTKWVLTVPATGAGQTIDIFSVYEKNKNRPLTVGKLRVVSYAVQRHTVTLVPVGVEAPDAGELQRKLNAIYAPYGVEFTVKVDGVIKDLEGWKGRTFKLEGNGFFTRENADMAEIRKAYQAVQSTPKGSYYVFVLGRADASSEDGATQANGAQGDMPRGQQFGYVFGDGVQDWSWLLAHELGHGVFTLQHLEDGNYGAKGTLGSIANLMNYTRSTELQAFQWNIMSNPAILTAFDSDDASKGSEDEVAAIIDVFNKYAEHYGNGVFLALHGYDCDNKKNIENSAQLAYSNDIEILNSRTVSINNTSKGVTAIVFMLKKNNDGYNYEYQQKSINYNDLTQEVKNKIYNQTDYLQLYKYKEGKFDILRQSSETGNLKTEICTIKNESSKDQYSKYIKHVLDEILRIKSRSIMLFVNGYKLADPTSSDNKVLMYDFENYWVGVDVKFKNYRNIGRSYYASGDFSVTTANQSGFKTRFENGIIAGRKLVVDLIKTRSTVYDTLDVVCHSMGFAYAQGMIDEVLSSIKAKSLSITLGGYYIIAPKNPEEGIVDPTLWKEVWHYGSGDEDAFYEQDWIAPQGDIKGLENKRIPIPSDRPKGPLGSHSIGNYTWVFDIPDTEKGFITPRKKDY